MVVFTGPAAVVSILGMNTGKELAVWIENRTIEQKYSALSPSKNGWSLVSPNLKSGGLLELKLLLTASMSRYT